jgi:hypothetical protein
MIDSMTIERDSAVMRWDEIGQTVLLTVMVGDFRNSSGLLVMLDFGSYLLLLFSISHNLSIVFLNLHSSDSRSMIVQRKAREE